MGYFHRFVILIFLVCSYAHSSAQEKIAYQLNVSCQNATNHFDFFGIVSQPLRFNWTIEQQPFSLENTIPGRLVIKASKDSIQSADDLIVLDSMCALPQFSYNEKPVRHSLSQGEYYLFSTYYASNLNMYEKESKTVRQRIQLFEISHANPASWLSHIKYSEYNEDISLHLEMDVTLSCCANLLGVLNSEWEVGLGKKAGVVSASLATFYRIDSLRAGPNRLIMEQSLFEKPNFEKYNFLIITRSSSYFSEGYRTIPDFTISLPLKVITDVEELGSQKRKQYPYLTYGKFVVSEKELSTARFDSLYKEAQAFYRFTENAIESARLRKTNEALQWADSAFSYAGDHRLSSMIYVPASCVSDLYAGLYKFMEANQLFTNIKEKEKLSFRLGEAMNMADLMEEGYAHLIRMILPDTLSILNEIEKSGFYDEKDKFRQSNITELPVLWRERTLPAFEHFLRIRDLETADIIATQAGEHIQLVSPLWRKISSDTSLAKHYSSLANSLTESTEMLDFELARLNYFSELGLYEDAEATIKETSDAYACSYRFQPDKFWLTAGRFYEDAGNFAKADSLYALSDNYIHSEIDKEKDNVLKAKLRLKSGNTELLKAKMNATGNVINGKQITVDFETMRIKASIFMQMDLLADHDLAQKLGFFNSPAYPNYYLNQIKNMEMQGEHFLANEWMKELAFFLGRDNKNKEALLVYKNLFLINNLQSIAFRLGFSEESQIFYSQKQLEILSRYINVLVKHKGNASAEEYDSLLNICLDQVLFQHSFILRGNYQLLYDVSHSKDEAVQRQFVIWQTLREYLNELYVKEEPDKHGLKLMKTEILRAESKLTRLARDTSSMRYDYIPPLDSIRKHLKENEAAIELIRYELNHEVYYNKSSKYAALIVKKTGPIELILFPTEGALMEGRNYNLYRNSIQQKLMDEISYRVYWEPLQASLKEVKKVYWAPDGVFHLINPNTLFNISTQKYLLDEIQVQVVPTIANLSDEKSLKISSATILGNPVYNESDSPQKSDTLHTSRSLLSRQAIAPLPGTKAEVETIATLLRQAKSDVILLTEKKASKQELFKIKNADVLHLATHGFWIDNPQRHADVRNVFETLSGSGLILSGAQKNDGAGGFQIVPQGIVTSAEIQDLNLFNTQLVVLSACETGLGEVIPGEGLYGLKRALHKAGARNIITSLWKVDDEATKEFMSGFYKSLSETKNLNESFKNAMSSLQKKFPDPYYWGAFVLTRN